MGSAHSASAFLPVRVHDAYVAGHALAQVSLFSFVTLADDQGKPELDAGSLQRYLAESVWIPTVLLPGGGIQWGLIDDNTALATLTDSGTTVSLEFHFNDTGEVVGVYTPIRFRFVNWNYEPTPWEGRHKNYIEKSGMRVPIEGEVIWHLPAGKYFVWKGKIRDIQYNFVY